MLEGEMKMLRFVLFLIILGVKCIEKSHKTAKNAHIPTIKLKCANKKANKIWLF